MLIMKDRLNKGMQKRWLVDRLEVVGQATAVRDKIQHSRSYINIAWHREMHIARPLLLLSEAPRCIPGVMLNVATFVCPSDFLISLSFFTSIYLGNTNSVFALDYISGSLTVNGQLDRENPLYSAGFTLTVKVSWWMGGSWRDCRSRDKGSKSGFISGSRESFDMSALNQCSVWV